jgi:cytochrome P450
MTQPATVVDHTLSLPEELLLMLLNEESGYFYQVPGWTLNCAVIGAVITELAFRYRIDSDLESLFLIDSTPTGIPTLDPLLAEIADEPEQHSTEYWIERLAPRADAIVDMVLNHLVERGLLQYHEGDFWTLSRTVWQADSGLEDDAAGAFVKTRIPTIILSDAIPDPRDVITIALLNACNVLPLIMPFDEEAEERVELICRIDIIGRSIAEAVSSNIARPQLHSSLTKEIPRLSLRKVLFNRHLRSGNFPAFFADLHREYGPVFELRQPFSSESYIILAGPEVNRWVQKHGRLSLRSKEYLASVEAAHGTARTIHTMDGADHFRFRKALQPSHSPETFIRRMDEVYRTARRHMAAWDVGDTLPAEPTFRAYMNAQMSPLLISLDTQDIFEDVFAYNRSVLVTHLSGFLPKFVMKTPSMRRRGKIVARLAERIKASHTPAQREGRPPDVIDGYLGIHANDEQFLPESDLGFPLDALTLTGQYLGDMTSFAFYHLASNPEIYRRVQAEADALFANGDPTGEDLSPANIDVTHRVLMETLRLTPNVNLSMRTVMNSCMVEGYQLPLGARLLIAQTAPHYMEDVFPDPFTFDIDRYLPPRNEHLGPGYTPYGLGTHRCLGFQWAEMHVALNVLMLAHHFTFELSPPNAPLRISPLPTQSLSKKIKLVIKERRHDIPAWSD